MPDKSTLPVTIDKSHLITIGERLYSSSVELVRELVNNAYDADAEEVKVTIGDNEISVVDNGSGMDLRGLKQYFKIGSPEKMLRGKSPIFKRDRIGQFGIGKFATLSACERFEVFTQKGTFAANVVFDKTQWQELSEDWHLPLSRLEADTERGDGTKVTLSKLFKKLDIDLVSQKITESVPLKAPHFAVYLNGVRMAPRTLSGHRIPVLKGTEFGIVSGEIVILSASQAGTGEPGIEIKVKQALIKRDLLGMETWGRDMARVRGEVYADWLPITSDRTGFVIDSPQYLAFKAAMTETIAEVKETMGRLEGKKTGAGAKRAMREALERIAKSLTRHPDLSPFGATPLAESDDEGNEAATREAEPGERAVKAPAENEEKSKEAKNVKEGERTKKSSVELLTPNAVVQKLKFGGAQVSCCLDNFGPEGPEVFTEGTIIYVNRDHPLYRRESRKKETHVLNLTRLIAQELSMMKDGVNPRQAYDHQSILLKDAFAEE